MRIAQIQTNRNNEPFNKYIWYSQSTTNPKRMHQVRMFNCCQAQSVMQVKYGHCAEGATRLHMGRPDRHLLHGSVDSIAEHTKHSLHCRKHCTTQPDYSQQHGSLHRHHTQLPFKSSLCTWHCSAHCSHCRNNSMGFFATAEHCVEPPHSNCHLSLCS